MQYIFISDENFELLTRNTNKNKNDYFDSNNLSVLTIADLTIYKTVNDKIEAENINLFNHQNFVSSFFYMDNTNRENYYNSSDLNYRDNSEIVNITFDVINKEDLNFELSYFKEASGLYSIIPISMLENYTEEQPGLTQMFFKAQDHKSVFEQMNKFIIEKDLDVFLDDITSGFETQENTVGMIDVFSKIFILLISVITLLNAFNTTLANFLIRKREFAIMKSIGMTTKSLAKMLILESCICGGIALGCGFIISAFISYLLKISFSNGSLKFVLPLNHVLISIIGIVLVFTVTLVYAIKKMSSVNIIDTIKNETT